MRFLFVDRILEMIPGKLVRGIKHITADDVYLTSDHRGYACFAPSLIGETLGQLAAWNVMLSNDFTRRPVAGVVSSARMHRPAYVGDMLLLESIIDELDGQAVQYHSTAWVGGEEVFSIDGALGPLLPMADFIDSEQIRAQFAEIDRAGDWQTASQIPAAQELVPFSQIAMHIPLQFDRVVQCTPGQSISAEKRVTRSAAYFPDHFPRKPVLPMTVLLECKRNLAQTFLQKSGLADNYQVSELRKIKMNEFVMPGDVVQSHAVVQQHNEQELVLRYRSEVNGKRVCVVDAVMTARG
ncbi:3-hydroxyacyl-ACP dehydratase FabZ family protein [Legionella dresdenensis]|uniref:3-hydroxyacyl-ACP dehydratase FabZ family protein n=1 Tax=Legionella dresdenensis TaxID=450200 RepID=A0ABV8CF24_9GAMM